jgi:hypothetical protein
MWETGNCKYCGWPESHKKKWEFIGSKLDKLLMTFVMLFFGFLFNGAVLGWNIYCIANGGGLLNYICAGIAFATLLFLVRGNT